MNPTELGKTILGRLTHPELAELARRANNESVYAFFSQNQDIQETSKLLGLEAIYQAYCEKGAALIKTSKDSEMVTAAANYHYYLLEQICLPDISNTV